MNILGFGIGGRSTFVVLAFSAALAVACSAKDDSGDDDDDDTGGGGTSPFGGAAGTSGTAGTNTGGTAGVLSTGGTGSGQVTCLSLCQRVQMCANATPVNCATDCEMLEAEAASLGCTTQYRSFVACYSASANVCTPETSGCDPLAAAYVMCIGA